MFRPKKRYGQHFLIDKDVVRDIISLAGFKDSDTILEIGPGSGALTVPLSASVRHITAVEKDPWLAEALARKLSGKGIENVTVSNEDILGFALERVRPLGSKGIQVIGNIPYNISSPLLEKLMVNKGFIQWAVLMLQSEVAERITASPGTKAYGALTLILGFHCTTAPMLDVSRKAFRPVPKVDSTLVKLDFTRPFPAKDVNAVSFKKVVKGAFYHRRKTVLNSLSRYFSQLDRGRLAEILEKCGIDPDQRAESLAMDEFVTLAREIDN